MTRHPRRAPAGSWPPPQGRLAVGSRLAAVVWRPCHHQRAPRTFPAGSPPSVQVQYQTVCAPLHDHSPIRAYAAKPAPQARRPPCHHRVTSQTSTMATWSRCMARWVTVWVWVVVWGCWVVAAAAQDGGTRPAVSGSMRRLLPPLWLTRAGGMRRRCGGRHGRGSRGGYRPARWPPGPGRAPPRLSACAYLTPQLQGMDPRRRRDNLQRGRAHMDLTPEDALRCARRSARRPVLPCADTRRFLLAGSSSGKNTFASMKVPPAPSSVP
jgi:hypothetical protein